MKSTNPIAEAFWMLPFESDDTSYYNYRWWILASIIINSIVTYAVEKLIVVNLTRRSDQRQAQRKQRRIDEGMKQLERDRST